MTQHTTDTVVVGAGPAGLAVGACLRQAGQPFVMLEQQGAVGAAWRTHYDRLHLHTDKAHSALPLLPYPEDYPRYLSRLQFIRYLEVYAEQFALAPRFGQRVVSARRHAGVWMVQTHDAQYRSANLVIATGYTRVPVVPEWPGRAAFQGPILHSAQYKNGQLFEGQRVLVVGFGNSGGEIAIDLCEHGARPSIAVRSPVNVIPKELFGLPILALTPFLMRLPAWLTDVLVGPIFRLKYGDPARLGLRRLPYGPLTQVRRDARVPLIDVGTMALIKQGRIQVRSGIERFAGNEVRFHDGRQEPYDAVVLATGYRPRVDAFLEDAGEVLDDRGTPRRSGVEAAPGLYFCGFYVSPAGGLRQIAKEARAIAEAIARQPPEAVCASSG